MQQDAKEEEGWEARRAPSQATEGKSIPAATKANRPSAAVSRSSERERRGLQLHTARLPHRPSARRGLTDVSENGTAAQPLQVRFGKATGHLHQTGTGAFCSPKRTGTRLLCSAVPFASHCVLPWLWHRQPLLRLTALSNDGLHANLLMPRGFGKKPNQRRTRRNVVLGRRGPERGILSPRAVANPSRMAAASKQPPASAPRRQEARGSPEGQGRLPRPHVPAKRELL